MDNHYTTCLTCFNCSKQKRKPINIYLVPYSFTLQYTKLNTTAQISRCIHRNSSAMNPILKPRNAKDSNLYSRSVGILKLNKLVTRRIAFVDAAVERLCRFLGNTSIVIRETNWAKWTFQTCKNKQ